MDMVHEKIFTVPTGMQVKIIVRGYFSYGLAEVEPFVEIWVKQQMDTCFSIPGELNLPMYCGFENDEKQNIKELVIKVSGISDQQFDQVISEFRNITRSSVLF